MIKIVRFNRELHGEQVENLVWRAYGPRGSMGLNWTKQKCQEFLRIFATETPLCLVAYEVPEGSDAAETCKIAGVILARTQPTNPGIVDLHTLEPRAGLVAEALYNALVEIVKEKNLPGIMPTVSDCVSICTFAPLGMRTEFYLKQGGKILGTWVQIEHRIDV